MAVPGRLVTAMATPFTDDGGLDVPGARRLAQHLVATGTETVLVNGTTGESPALAPDELETLVGAVREAVDGDATILLGTGTNVTDRTVANTVRASELGADAVLVVTPYYNRPSQRGLLAHFGAVADATDLPVVLYDIPGRTACEIELATHVELSRRHPNVVGVKDAVGDLARAAEIVAGTRPDYHVWCGDDALNLPFLAVGARGFVSTAGNVVGRELSDVLQVFATDPAKAREVHARCMPVHRALFLEPNPGPLKAALGSARSARRRGAFADGHGDRRHAACPGRGAARARVRAGRRR